MDGPAPGGFAAQTQVLEWCIGISVFVAIVVFAWLLEALLCVLCACDSAYTIIFATHTVSPLIQYCVII